MKRRVLTTGSDTRKLILFGVNYNKKPTLRQLNLEIRKTPFWEELLRSSFLDQVDLTNYNTKSFDLREQCGRSYSLSKGRRLLPECSTVIVSKKVFSLFLG